MPFTSPTPPLSILQPNNKHASSILHVCRFLTKLFLLSTFQGNIGSVAAVNEPASSGAGDSNKRATHPFPASLRRLLVDPAIAFVGYRIFADLMKLNRDFDFGFPLQKKTKGRTIAKAYNFADIGDTACEKFGSVLPGGLAGLVKKVFNKNMIKSTSLSCSDWSAADLSPPQEMYAATDAFAVLALHERLLEMQPVLRTENNASANDGDCEEVEKLEDGDIVIATMRDGTSYFGQITTTRYSFRKDAPINVREFVESNDGGTRGTRVYHAGRTSSVNEKSLTYVYGHLYERIRPDRIRAPSVDNTLAECRRIYAIRAPPSSVDSSMADTDATTRDATTRLSAAADDDADDARGGGGRDDARGGGGRRNVAAESGLKADHFHVEQMITQTMKQSSGARGTAAHLIRDTLLVADPRAIERAKQRHGDRGADTNRLTMGQLRNDPRVWKVAPPPVELLQRFNFVCGVLEEVDARCREVGKPLFSGDDGATTRKKLDSVRAMIEGGYLSDPPDFDMYVEREAQNCSLFRVLRCVRGTSMLEGLHKHLREVCPSTIVSPDLLHWILQNFYAFNWNFRIQVRTGREEDCGMPEAFDAMHAVIEASEGDDAKALFSERQAPLHHPVLQKEIAFLKQKRFQVGDRVS